MISAIIDSLSSDEDVTKPLLKTLAFARRIGNKELSEWVLNELNGYGNNIPLPEYRYAKIINQAILSPLNNPYVREETPLPISCFNDELQQMLMKHAFNESIAGLEAITKTDNNYLTKELSIDLCRFLSDDAKKHGCKFSVRSCRQLVNISEIPGIITNIKTKLMELLLEIEQDYPGIDALTADGTVKEKLNTIVNQHIGHIYHINTSGERTLVNTGDQNEIK